MSTGGQDGLENMAKRKVGRPVGTTKKRQEDDSADISILSSPPAKSTAAAKRGATDPAKPAQVNKRVTRNTSGLLVSDPTTAEEQADVSVVIETPQREPRPQLQQFTHIQPIGGKGQDSVFFGANTQETGAQTQPQQLPAVEATQCATGASSLRILLARDGPVDEYLVIPGEELDWVRAADVSI